MNPIAALSPAAVSPVAFTVEASMSPLNVPVTVSTAVDIISAGFCPT